MKINKKSSLQSSQVHQLSHNNFESISRKHSLRENTNAFQNTQPINFNSLGMSNNEKMVGLGHGLMSDSQPILAKANEKPNILLSSNNSQITVHRRNPSHQYSQQLSLGETTSQANQMNQDNQRHQNILNSQPSSKQSANNSIAGSGPSMIQSTKNSQTQQIIFSHPSHIDLASKENTNQVANSQNYLQFKQQSENMKNQKSQTLKFSINNLISEITQKSGNQNHQQQNKPPITAQVSSQNINESSSNTTSQSKLMMQSILAAKNHQTLISQKHIQSGSNKNIANQTVVSNQQSQQQLVSSKMMMALHKKCNSIANQSNVSNYVMSQNGRDQSQQPQSSNVTCLVLDQENNYNSTVKHPAGVSSKNPSNSLRQKPSQKNLLQNYESQQPTSNSQTNRKNLNQISQIEFFDENVRVNHVPQITPRHQDKRKTLAQPNDRYKNIDLLSSSTSQIQPQSTKNEFNQMPLSIISNFENYYSKKENININSNKNHHQNYSSKVLVNHQKQKSQVITVKESIVNAYQSNPNPVQAKVMPNKRYQEESEESQCQSSRGQLLLEQRTAFEMKRRSCGQNDHHQSRGIDKDLLEDNVKDQLNNVLLQSQRANSGAFAANFGLRKFSQQLQFSNKLISKQDEILQNHLNQVNQQHAISTNQLESSSLYNNLPQQQVLMNQQQQDNTSRRQSNGDYQQQKQNLKNPKDEIVKYFSKYIKQSKMDQNELFKQDAEYEETIQNLKDFLQYLEDKNIINCQKLENDKEEMKNLIDDLMKLDLKKFSNKEPAQTCKNSPQQRNNNNNFKQEDVVQNQNYQPQQFENKRNSADFFSINGNRNEQQYVINQKFQQHQNQQISKAFQIQSPNTQNDKRSIPRSNQNNSYKHKLPLNSPNQDYNSNSRSTSIDHTPQSVQTNLNGQNIVCYYAPVNVNGNGNVVNTNFSIFPASQSSAIPTSKNQSQYSNHYNPSQQNKQFNCSQKLFNINKNSFDSDEQLENLNQNNIEMMVMEGGNNLKKSQMLPNQQQPIFFQHPPSGNHGHKRVNSIGSGLQQPKKVQSMLITPTSNNNLNKKMNFGFAQQYNQGINMHSQPQYVALDHQQHPQQQKDQTYLNEKHQQLKLKLSNGKEQLQIQQQQQIQMQAPIQQQQHFHQRKNSLFLQQQLFNADEDNNIQLRNKFYPNQVQQQQNPTNQQDENDTDESNQAIVVQHKSRLTHRRATTNLIQPTNQSSSQLLAAKIQTLQMPQSTTNQIVASNGQAIFNDDIGLIEERDKLIKYIKLYTSKRLEIPQTSLDYYKFMKLIGKGAFGKVTLGIHKLTGKQVAIKTVDKSLMRDEYQRKKVLQEVHLLKKVRHQNVIRLLEVFESPKHLLMVMEYAGGGDLLQYVKKRRRLEEDEAKKIFRQVVYGLAHCHCRSVLHRDIKLDNILLDNEGEIKICDFGVSRIIKKNQRITEQCGTPAYIAPEIISDSGYEGFSADVWSLGVLLYAMLCGTVPFKAQNMHDLHQIITSGSFQYPPQVEPLLSQESKDLINKMLVLNPLERISIPEILSHPWMITRDEMGMMLGEDDMLDFANSNGTMLNKRDMYTLGGGSSSFPSNQINETQGNNQQEPDINQVLVDNLFLSPSSFKAKLSYTDYCAITQDFATMHMNEEALQVMEGMGLPRKVVREGLNKGELNHATATYNLLVLN